jgi:replicative DNA helicase
MNNDVEPPRDAAAEERLLASMMFCSEACDTAAKTVARADFFGVGRGVVFEALLALRERCAAPDLVLLFDELRRRGQDERVGGPLEIARIAELVPSGANVEYYAAIVRGLGRRRRLMRACERLHRRAADLSVPESELAFRESSEEDAA